MSRIRKSEKYAVLWLSSQGIGADDIAQELDLKITQVKNVIKNNGGSPDSDSSNVTMSKPSSKNLMITESQSGKHKVAIMTKAASEMNDDMAKKHRATNNKDNPNIYRPHG